MPKFRIVKFLLLSLALYTFPCQAKILSCGTSLSDESHFVRYTVELDGASRWSYAVVRLTEGTPLHYLPKLPFSMRCENASNLVTCRLNVLDTSNPAPTFHQTTFTWISRGWSGTEDTMTLTFKAWDHSVEYQCQE
ncbi:MAG: hypothetical protein KA436_03185 [Oligoflexales bacterium]|nr:hypothetical protein [Oligoflexales bacterium]